MLTLAPFAEVKARLADLAVELRRYPAVHAATTAETPRAYDGEDRVECYVAAELASGTSWGAGWSSEAKAARGSSRRASASTTMEARTSWSGFPRGTRSMTEELVAEVRGAVSRLVEAARGMDVSEP
jgi:hypothetical protein